MPQSKSLRFFAYFLVVLFLIVYIFPLVYLINVSLKSNQNFILHPNALAVHLHFYNFIEAWKQGGFSKSIGNSILYTGVSTFLTLIFSMFAAFPIARKYVRGSSILYSFFLLSLFLPNPLVPQFILMKSLGLYNSQLGYIILKTNGTNIAFFMFVGYLKSVSRELDEAAAIDGCGYIRYMFNIILPLMKPVLATGLILTAIMTWNDIIFPTIYLSNPKFAPMTLGLFNFYGQYSNNWPLLACGILIVALPLIILYVLLQRYIVGGALSGAIKS